MKHQKPIQLTNEKKRAVIAGIQSLVLILSLFIMIYIGKNDSRDMDFNTFPMLFSNLVAGSVATFFGTLLLIKGLRLFFSSDAPADRFVTFRKVTYVVSWVLIAAYCLFLLVIFSGFLGINVPFFISAQIGNFIMNNITILSVLTAVLFRLKNL